MFYSKSSNGFYTLEIHGQNIPEDAVEITDEEYQALLDGQNNGKVITYDQNNHPILVDPPKATKEQVIAHIKAMRDSRTQGGGYKIVVNGQDKWFHSDLVSRSQQFGLKDSARDQITAGNPLTAQILIDGKPQPWKTMDGSFIILTIQIVIDVVNAAKSSDSAIFKAAETHAAAVQASSDPSTYDYSGGWPISFQDSHPLSFGSELP